MNKNLKYPICIISKDRADSCKTALLFDPYKIDEALMELTGADYVMHCQPAHRDLEISGSLIDGEKSLLMQQAENRMHGQNAILVQLLAANFKPAN